MPLQTSLSSRQSNLTFSYPLSSNTSTISLNIDSSLNLDGTTNKLKVANPSQWTTTGTNIYNTNTGNVGIGTNNPISLLDINSTNYTGSLLVLDAGIVGSTTQMPRAIGQPLIKLGKTSYSTTAGDYYGIGFGYSPLLTDKQCCEIGCIITDKTQFEGGNLIFSTRPTSTTSLAANERMRITSAGNIGIGTTNSSAEKLEVNGNIKCNNIIQTNIVYGFFTGYMKISADNRGYDRFFNNGASVQFLSLDSTIFNNNISVSYEIITIQIKGLYLIKFKATSLGNSGRFFISKNMAYGNAIAENINPPNTNYIINYTISYQTSCELVSFTLLNVNDTIRCGVNNVSSTNGYFNTSIVTITLISRN